MNKRALEVVFAALLVGLAAGAFAQDSESVHDATTTLDGTPSVPDSHTVEGGDTLWDIANRYFRDPYEWPKVWSYNPEITNPHWIYPGALVNLRPGVEPVPGQAPGDTQGFLTRGAEEVQGIYLRDQGYLDPKAFDNAGFIVAAREEQMMMSDSDVVYVRLKKKAERNIGGNYTIYRRIRRAERLKVEKGELVRIMGTVRLDDYDEKLNMGHATIVETLEPIERGYKVAPMMRRFHMVEARENKMNLTAKVIAVLYDLKVISNYQLVFLDVGENKGVEEGNRFYVMRSGDEWRVSVKGRVGREIQTTVPLPEEPERFPDEIVAEGLVVSVRPTTSALLITNTVRAVSVGDRVEMVQGH